MSTTIWNKRYANKSRASKTQYEPWLQRWKPLLNHINGRALDLGCGAGFDTEVLVSIGYTVTAIDLSSAAVELSRKRNPNTIHRVADVRNLNSFLNSPYDLIIASLSLHYFDQQDTRKIFDSIYKLLKPSGIFAFRVNAYDDVESGAPEDATAWDCVDVAGVTKQFFTEEKIAWLLDDRFHVISQEKLTTHRYGHAKSLYEVVTKKIKS